MTNKQQKTLICNWSGCEQEGTKLLNKRFGCGSVYCLEHWKILTTRRFKLKNE